MPAGGEGGPVRPHQAGDVGTDHLPAGEQLEGPQHRIVEEGATLDHHGVTELAGVLELDHLVEGVADHRIGQPGGDVADAGPLLLGLFHRGVHEDRAAAAEIGRTGRLQRRLREVAYVGAHGLGERLQERPAAGGAGLVDRDRVDDVVTDPQVLHVLAADVDHRGDAGAEVFGGPVVGHRLDLALVEVQRAADQILPVAGDAGADDPGRLRQFVDDPAQDRDRGGHWVALVGGVVGEDDLVVLVGDHRLDRRRAGVDAEEAVAGGLLDVALRDARPGVALLERRQLVGIGEQRPHPRGLQRDDRTVPQPADQHVEGLRLPVGEQRGADRHVELGPLRGAEGAAAGGQHRGVRLPQPRQEVQRTAQEHDVAADRPAAGQPGHRLGGDGPEDRGGQVLGRRTLVDQRLDVGLGEHPAARGDRVDVRGRRGEGVQTGGVGVQQAGHLVDEGAGATGAAAVHPLLGGRVQVGDLGVLAAELDHHVGVGVVAADRRRLGDHLLDEGHAHQARHRQAAGPGHRGPHRPARQGGGHLAQQPGELAPDVGVMATVLLEQGPVPVEHDGFDGRRPHVHSEPQHGPVPARSDDGIRHDAPSPSRHRHPQQCDTPRTTHRSDHCWIHQTETGSSRTATVDP
ncbi:hypothetical protein SDC9_93981 [bioreactor metagenome]|uniref:Uncharacterized protein n=1 Tax=bioreactor metagenome TaxID=1076179 RepID=A0A645A8T8_9ZZZZ